MSDQSLAAVDCGTNSTRLLVVHPDGKVAAREMTITRLGEGVDAGRRLLPDAMERTLAVLRDYRRIMDTFGAARSRVVATSAARDATNAEDLNADGVNCGNLASKARQRESPCGSRHHHRDERFYAHP